MMLKIVAVAVSALFVTASPLAYAQAPSEKETEHLSVADWSKLTDLRIDLVKAALQLTPDQTKYWSAIEEAIRGRAKDRQARLAKIEETMGKRSDERDPVAFLNRRADALAHRSADLKKLADAWEPLYKTLTSEQKKRMAALTLFVLHDMSEGMEQRRAQSDEDD